ncbi:MAG: hypothetical protein LC118_10615 [Dehalococcoidia bacterium]|nr:hypothetical protein [Dehalococcoidia bacterium]
MPRPRTRSREFAPPAGETRTLRIESLVFGGAGLAHSDDGRIVFVLYAAPGELVEALIGGSMLITSKP